jgi:hypothetical protein
MQVSFLVNKGIIYSFMRTYCCRASLQGGDVKTVEAPCIDTQFSMYYLEQSALCAGVKLTLRREGNSMTYLF